MWPQALGGGRSPHLHMGGSAPRQPHWRHRKSPPLDASILHSPYKAVLSSVPYFTETQKSRKGRREGGAVRPLPGSLAQAPALRHLAGRPSCRSSEGQKQGCAWGRGGPGGPVWVCHDLHQLRVLPAVLPRSAGLLFHHRGRITLPAASSPRN